MKLPETQNSRFDAAEWEKRKRSNKRLGYLFGAIVLADLFGFDMEISPVLTGTFARLIASAAICAWRSSWALWPCFLSVLVLPWCRCMT